MPPVKIGVLISGGGSNLQALIDKIENKAIRGEVKLIISNKSDAYGLVRGERAGIESIFIDRKTFGSEEEYNLELIRRFKEKDIELIILAGYLRVLSKDFIREYRNRIINIHPSLIPSFSGQGYYGERVHREVLAYGVKYTGATVHFVDETTDTGPIILQEVVAVEDGDDLEAIKDKVLKIEHRILTRAVAYYCEARLEIEGRKVRVKEV